MSCSYWRLAAGLFLACSLGCTSNQPGTAVDATPVGTVDLDRAAKELGLSEQMDNIVEAQRQKMTAELVEVKSRLQANFDDKKKEFGANPALKDKEQLQLLEMQSNQFLAQLDRQGGAQLQESRLAMVRQLRQKFAGTIQQLAKKHGMKVVLTSTEMVIYSAPTIDITGDLIEALRDESAAIKLTPPSPPTTQAASMGTPAPSGASNTTSGEAPAKK